MRTDMEQRVCHWAAPLLVFLLTWVAVAPAEAALFAEDYAEVQVADPYIELHTGPGVGYPVFYVVDRDAVVQVLKRKTDWFKVRAHNGKEGWVSWQQLEKTLTLDGQTSQLKEAALGDFSARRWEVGLLGGAFNHSPVMSLYAGYAFNANLSAEVSGSKVLGDFFSSNLVNLNLLAQPFHRRRVAPFFTLGVGHIATRPRTTLVPPKDSDDFSAHAGIGLRAYLTRRFILRVEYKDYVAFSSDDNNEEFREWKAGFAFFF